MAVLEPRPNRTTDQPTEKRIVETTPDGTIIRSEPVRAEPARERVEVDPRAAPPKQVIQTAAPTQAPPQVIRVKSGGSVALWAVVLVLLAALAAAGFYVYQTRDDTVQKQQVEQQLQTERAQTEQRLQQLGRAADDLNAQVRDAQRDLGAAPASPAAPAPSAAPSPAPAQPAPQ